MAALVDTNILVYRCDNRFPDKQERARTILRQGILQNNLRIPHQALVEFYSVVTRGPEGHSLLSQTEALRQAEDLMVEFQFSIPMRKW